ncbi:MAG TPA: translation initiation factor IF-3 [Cyanobacteria bacterium UBA8803]|nr:translation initiation factor IF-3 [Cyanobacteria bacterium UBA9273]HBL60294.1 translation initiation factor IF-3 [Cyanobacteria bacterium UBA8803]
MLIEQKKQNRDLPIINERIRFPEIRVIDTDGTQLGIMSSRDALRIAEEKELDLVLVNDKGEVPVCRVMDYDKWKYQQSKNIGKARPTVVKEVKMSYNIAEHDYQVRVNQAGRFLKSGDKVKATILLKGREIQHSDLAEALLKRMSVDLQETAELEQSPKREGNKMTMLLSPKTSKKSGNKKSLAKS